jgi:hypothetical protein
MRLSKKLVAIPYERVYGEPNQNVVFDNLLHELAGDAVLREPVSGANSLLAGKLTGNFCRFDHSAAISALDQGGNSMVCKRIPYETEQGIF